MAKEHVLERIKYLERVSDRLEKAMVYLLAALVASPLIERLTGIAMVAFIVLTLLAVAVLSIAVYRVRAAIESLWAKLLREDPRLIAFPWIGLAVLLAGLGLLISMLLS